MLTSSAVEAEVSLSLWQRRTSYPERSSSRGAGRRLNRSVCLQGKLKLKRHCIRTARTTDIATLHYAGLQTVTVWLYFATKIGDSATKFYI